VKIAALLVGAALAVVLGVPHLAAAPAPRKPVDRIVYAAGDSLWSVAPNGTGRVRLVRGPGADAAPALSPDGFQLAYVRDTRLVVARSDGTGPRAVTAPRGDTSPSWSPDGRTLVFARANGLWTVVPGESARQLPLDPALKASDPAWSPDGTRIAFTGEDVSLNDDIYLLTPSTGDLVRLTSDPAREAEPAWSPDGRQLAYVFSDGTEPPTAAATEIRVMAADGTGAQPVTSGLGLECPDWSPDGRRVLVRRQGRLETIGPGGSVVRRLGAAGCGDWGRALLPALEPETPKDELLPDLDPREPTDLSVITGGGRELLGFDSAVDSIGRGPMWLRGRRTSVRTPLMEARQIVNLTTGGVRTYRRVGSMRYTFSPTHIHWHILDFVRYELRRASDFRLVTRDYKTGFCLGDHYGVAGRRRVPPPRFNGNCGQGRPELLEVEQGNSVGYSDKYPSYYHGQYVELTRAPAGLYVLVHRANPRRMLHESNYANNASSVLIRLTRTGGRPAIRVLRSCARTDRCLPPE
jgi:dipeptidyl aminopeptidase/acylaminoacyl peptidase